MSNLPRGGRKPKIVGKTTSLRKLLVGKLTRDVDLGRWHPLPYPQLCGYLEHDDNDVLFVVRGLEKLVLSTLEKI